MGLVVADGRAQEAQAVLIVPVRVAAEIEVRVDDLPPGQLELIRGALTFRNEERDKQASLRTFGWWDQPETISLWRDERRRGGDHVLCLPRGFASQLSSGLQGAGHSIRWDDRRSIALADPGYFVPFLLRSYQAEFVSAMMNAEQGVGDSPTGSGKSVMVLGLMALLQQRAIVIVDQESLLEQWRARAAQFLGLSTDLSDERSVGKIGKGTWEERDLTICTRQTLFSRQWQTDALDWASRWGLCVLDEVQSAGSAETLQEVVRALPCRYMFGVSATPSRSETQGLVIAALVGPLVAKVPREELVAAGVLVQPTVRVVRSDFEADFWPDHESDHEGNCEKPDCEKTAQHSHKNNWSSCLRTLVESKERNAMIAEMICSEPDHVHLVPSRQLKHLDLIERALRAAGYDRPIYKLRGEENARGESVAITETMAEAGGGVLLSTVADKGLDVPPLDRLWMVFPVRQPAATVQIVGRVERAFPGKTSSVVVEVHDPGCGVFDDQHRERMRTYRSQGLMMEHIEEAAGHEIDDFIEWWSFPERNEVWYRHRGCDGDFSSWLNPYDGDDPSEDTYECPNCCAIVSLTARSREPERQILISGSRKWSDRSMIFKYVSGLYREAYVSSDWLVVVHGGASGADAIAGEIANQLGVEVRVFEANWERGLSAGNQRNVEMLDHDPERVGAFSLGTSGTRHCVEEARRRGIHVDLHGPKGLVS